MNTKFFDLFNLEEMSDLRQSLLRLAASIRMLMNVKQLSTQANSSGSVITAESQNLILDQFVKDLLAVQSLIERVVSAVRTGSRSDSPMPTGSPNLTFTGDMSD